MSSSGDVDLLDPFRQLRAFPRDVLVLSLAMFAFSLGFQMTGRYLPEYLTALGASAFVVGLYGTLGNVVGAVYPYPGGRLSDRIGSRVALTLFGVASSLGFLVWLVAPTAGVIRIAGVAVEPWVWIFVGLLLAQAWKSFGLGATFAVVKQSVPPDRLARGFASTEVFRRTAFLLGPLLAAGILYGAATFTAGFRAILAVAVGAGVLATVAQHRLYDASEDTIGDEFAGITDVVADLRGLPSTLRPLLLADTLVRFANGMVYVFFVLVVAGGPDRGVRRTQAGRRARLRSVRDLSRAVDPCAGRPARFRAPVRLLGPAVRGLARTQGAHRWPSRGRRRRTGVWVVLPRS